MYYRTKQELPGGIHDSEFPSFSRSLLLWLEVSAKEVMILNLSLTPEDITESAAKGIAVQQKSLDSLAKIVVNRIALDYLLDEQGGICAVPNTTFCTWINSLRKLRLSYISLSKPFGL